ncbi:MAG TPA: nucleoside-diphosphate kinase [Acidimicrobiales bacterium]|nr:nucleoside-diphosphate kinase [Acidimicrobiales bacterium]
MDRTFVIVKPDGVERGLVGEIVGRLERKLLKIVAAELRLIDRASVERHYAEHVGKPFYEPTVTFMTRSPALLMIVEGPANTWSIVRTMVGATDPAMAAPGTIRGDLGLVTSENLIHASDSLESAEREIGIFFPHLV